MALISSRSNERVKQVRALGSKRERDESGVFFAEGLHLLRMAAETGAIIEQVVVAPERLTPEEQRLVDELAARRLPILEVTGAVFDSISFRDEAQSLGAVVRQRWDELPPAPDGRCWLALPEIQHPGNLGTLIRTNDAIGGDGVILIDQTTDPYHPVAVRGSLGAIFSQRLVRTSEAEFAAWISRGDCT